MGVPQQESCLFSAPADFIGGLPKAIGARPVVYREVWELSELHPDPGVVGWICHPGQRFVVGPKELERLPKLKVLVTASTGNNHVDLDACARAGVVFRSLLDHRARLEEIAASAEFTFLLLLESLRGLGRAAEEIAHRRWRHKEASMRGHELQGRRVGFVGMGRIGRRMARYCSAFGATSLYFDPFVDGLAIERVTDLPTLFRSSDSVVVCCSYTASTRNLIDGKLLAELPEGATLVNTARGEVIDEEALVSFAGRRPDVKIATDVVCGEVTGTPFDSPLLSASLPNVIVTPHIAGATVESQSKAAHIALDLVRRELDRRVE